jgi:hypothetical protein
VTRRRKIIVGACVAPLVAAAALGLFVLGANAAVRAAEQMMSRPLPRTCGELLPVVKRILVEHYTEKMGHGPTLETRDMLPKTDQQEMATPWIVGEDPEVGCRWSAELTAQPNWRCSVAMNEQRRHRTALDYRRDEIRGWYIRRERNMAMHWALMRAVRPEALPWLARWWHRHRPGGEPETPSGVLDPCAAGR